MVRRHCFLILWLVLMARILASGGSLTDAYHCAQVDAKKPFMLVLYRGDDFMASLLHCANDAGLNSAMVSAAVGSLGQPVLAYFNTKDHQYHTKKFSGNYELVSANGNITWAKNKRFAHIHVALGGPDYKTISGHLMSAVVAVVAELMITPLPEKAVRKYDAALHLMPISTP